MGLRIQRTDAEREKIRREVAPLHPSGREIVSKSDTRHYGDNNTIHHTGDINVQVDGAGRVVGVWFRCLALPFTQSIDNHREVYNPREIFIEAIDYTVNV